MGYGYSKADRDVLSVLQRKEVEFEKRINSKTHRIRRDREYFRCKLCGKFVRENDEIKHKPYCKLVHCKKCGRFIGEKGHACRFNM